MSKTDQTINKKEDTQDFEFDTDNLKKAKSLLSHYPDDRQQSAILPLLDLAQRQNKGWISKAVVDYLANFLHLAPIKIYEVASFYSMFNLRPVGKYLVQICRTTPCWLCGSDKLQLAAEQSLGITLGQTTSDNKFTLTEVECLGACVNAPVVQINDEYYEKLAPENFVQILTEMAKE